MRKQSKSLLLGLLTLLMLSLFAAGVQAAGEPEAKVMFNGEYVGALETTPVYTEYEMMYPLRETLSGLDAQFGWDAENQVITVTVGDTSADIALNLPTAVVTGPEGEWLLEMATAPFAGADARTYVPAELLAAVTGYGFGWDETEKTVVIIDYAPIFATMDEDFSILLKSAELDETDMETTYRGEADWMLDLTLMLASGEGTVEPVHMAAEGTMDSLQKGLDAEIVMDFILNLDDIMADVDDEELQALYGELKEFELQMLLNGETGEFYMSSPELFTYLGGYEENTWLKTNAYATYEAMGIDLQGMMLELADPNAEELPVGSMVAEAMAGTDMPLFVTTYGNVVKGYEVAKALLGDEAFTAEAQGDMTVYATELDGSDVWAEILKTATLEEIIGTVTAEEQNELNEILENIRLELSLGVQNDEVMWMDAYFLLDIPDVKIEYYINSGRTEGMAVVALEVPDAISMGYMMAIVMEETSQKVNVTPPQGAVIVDIDSMYDDMYTDYDYDYEYAEEIFEEMPAAEETDQKISKDGVVLW